MRKESKKHMLKSALAMGMVASLTICGGMSAFAEDAEEIGDTVVLYTSLTDAEINALTDCIAEVYPDLEIEVVNGGLGELTSRISAEAEDPQGDLVWGALTGVDGRTYEDIFEEWVSPECENVFEGMEITNGLYSSDHVSTVCFCVNTELEEELGVSIKSYQDLLNPELKGKIVLSDPNSSSAAWNNLSNIFSVYGIDTDESWDYIKQLMGNLVISTSSSVCFNSVADGEYVAGLTYEDGAVNLLKNGAENVRIQYPEEGTSAMIAGIGIIKNGPHNAAAKAVANFICSAEGQTALAEYMEGTLRFTNSGYTTPENAWLTPYDDIKWVERDLATLTEKKPELLEKWNTMWAEVNP